MLAIRYMETTAVSSMSCSDYLHHEDRSKVLQRLSRWMETSPINRYPSLMAMARVTVNGYEGLLPASHSTP